MQRIMRFYIFSFFAIFLSCIAAKKQHIQKEFAPFIIQSTEKSAHIENAHLLFPSLLPNKEKSAHASAIVAKDSMLMALFYAGTQEGAPDVKIYQSFLNTKNPTASWQDLGVLLTREELTKLSGRYIKKLGNPIVFKDSYNRVHLFVVGVSFGGWATSRIYQFRFSENLKEIYYIRELHIHPFANYSHLVRTNAIPLENGGFILPFAHEMWHKFPLVAFFDSNGNMLFTKRLNGLKAQLQPSIVAISPTDCAAIYRTNNRYNTKAYYQTCTDSGATWNPIQTSNIHNYDSSLLLVWLGNEAILITNDGKHTPFPKQAMRKQKGDRQTLSLYWLQDKKRGKFVYLKTIDITDRVGEVSYPAATISEGILHITYTYYRETIKHMPLPVQDILDLIEKKRQLLEKKGQFNREKQAIADKKEAA